MRPHRARMSDHLLETLSVRPSDCTVPRFLIMSLSATAALKYNVAFIRC